MVAARRTGWAQVADGFRFVGANRLLPGGLLPGTFTRARRHGAMTIGAVAVRGPAMLGLGLPGSILWACLSLALGGAADFVSMVFRGSILQTAAPDQMRGRMQGVFTVVVAGGPRPADLVHGLACAALGARTAVAAGGLAVLAGVVILATESPAFRRYRLLS
ncbi:MFS transporter [Actinocrinis puniceicyclus]|uniref:MFS transporter n=1 Tax=Actinocrinis puniceicyclus TaxID=977794 RepID=A0A8J7WQ49_9ACTN|nr:MFS transporter [Actinocrinis puniceicyclus]MBS2963974.1 MFS transporter [Actinocrinis puniceicyclus]